MRNNGQKQRMRGRNRKSHNPLGRLYESNGPDVKIRGTAAHVAEKYVQLARDAQASGDPIAAENYFQHAEHYFRLIAAAQEQFRQNQPFYRPESEGREESFDEESDMGQGGDFQPGPGRDNPPRDQAYGLREPQPYAQRPAQPQPGQTDEGGALGLPAFITGSGPQPQPQQPAHHGQNGYEPQSGDRFGHRRRRRHRGPRPDMGGGAEASDEGPTPPSSVE